MFRDYLRVAIKLIITDEERFHNTFQFYGQDPFDATKIVLSIEDSQLLQDIKADIEGLNPAPEPFFPKLRENRKGLKAKREVIWPGKEASIPRVRAILNEFEKFTVYKEDLLDYMGLGMDLVFTEQHMGTLVKMLNILKQGVKWHQLLEIMPKDKDES